MHPRSGVKPAATSPAEKGGQTTERRDFTAIASQQLPSQEAAMEGQPVPFLGKLLTLSPKGPARGYRYGRTGRLDFVTCGGTILARLRAARDQRGYRAGLQQISQAPMQRRPVGYTFIDWPSVGQMPGQVRVPVDLGGANEGRLPKLSRLLLELDFYHAYWLFPGVENFVGNVGVAPACIARFEVHRLVLFSLFNKGE